MLNASDRHLLRNDGCGELGLRTLFQPFVDVAARKVVAYEALTRTETSTSIGCLFERCDAQERKLLDLHCRSLALRSAARAGIRSLLSLNVSPSALVDFDTSWGVTLLQARKLGIEPSQLYLEITEDQAVSDASSLRPLLEEYRRQGCAVVLDDFGAGYSSLSLLAELSPDLVKLDMSLVRRLNADVRKRLIVRSVARMAEELKVAVLAEGVETLAESRVLQDMGIVLHQGYLYARPKAHELPTVNWAMLDKAPGRDTRPSVLPWVPVALAA